MVRALLCALVVFVLVVAAYLFPRLPSHRAMSVGRAGLGPPRFVTREGRPSKLSFEDMLRDDFEFDMRGSDVMVFLHIQKTGGTVFGRHLVRDLALERPCQCLRGRKRCRCARPPSAGGQRSWLFSRYSTGWKCGLHADWTELTACVDHAMDRAEKAPAKRRCDRENPRVLFHHLCSVHWRKVVLEHKISIWASSAALTDTFHEGIEVYGATRFQNAVGTSVARFMDLLQLCISSIIIKQDDVLYVPRDGVCIGSCIAPILSDLLLACYDRKLQESIGRFGVVRTFRYFYVTLLREPVARFLSEFRHVQRGATWRGSRHLCGGRAPTADELPLCFNGTDWRDVTFQEFLACPSNLAVNRQTRMLADLTLVGCYNRSGMSEHERDLLLLASARKNLRHTAFFGLTEEQHLSQQLFEATFGLHFVRPFEQLNETRSTAAQGRVPPDDLEAVRRLNHLDVQLYDYARKLMSERLQRLKERGPS